MDDRLAVYKTWAPDDAVWTAWAKPVLFANRVFYDYNLRIPEINWLSEMSGANNDIMIILDLPCQDGVEEGLSLAQNAGYRPVPLYNGVNGPNNSNMIVDVRDIVSALYKGADILSELNLSPDAPPVFLLDSNRMKGRGKEKGKYDNRWCIFPQDMPSGSFVLKQGIKKIIMRTHDNKIQDDLSHILCRYQEQGIKIYRSNGIELAVSRPSQFKSLMYRFQAICGLSRNATGGFGVQIPEETQSSGSGFYYGGMG